MISFMGILPSLPLKQRLPQGFELTRHSPPVEVRCLAIAPGFLKHYGPCWSLLQVYVGGPVEKSFA